MRYFVEEEVGICWLDRWKVVCWVDAGLKSLSLPAAVTRCELWHCIRHE